MPAKFRNKQFSAGVYHIYQRGKGKLFDSESDYRHYLNSLHQFVPEVGIKLLAFCLMPDHLHLLVRQQEPRAISSLMRKLSTAYSMYFHHQYHQLGTPFKSVYKAVLLTGDRETLHLSRFIHLNPATAMVTNLGPIRTVVRNNPSQYPYSSYIYYIEESSPKWIDILEVSRLVPSYQKFVEDQSIDSKSILGDRTIDI